MSWAEVFKINKNTKRALNEQLRDRTYNPLRVITSSATYTPEKTGIYRIICVGAGGDGYTRETNDVYRASGGCGGGVAIKDLRLLKSTTYNVTVNRTASFGNELTATAGGSTTWNSSGTVSTGTGGTASGGDYNFDGTVGDYGSGRNTARNGGSIGVVIGEFYRHSKINDRLGTILSYGESILNYGGGGPAIWSYDSTYGTSIYDISVVMPGLPAAVIIIPLEMEE